MAIAVSINGRLCGEHDAVVSVFDHGFLFGEGVYEVLRTYAHRPFLYEAHMRRLRESAARIALDVPFTDVGLLGTVRETMAAIPDRGEAYIRILLTRGVGDFTYDPKACPTPTLVVITKPFVGPSPDVYTQGVKVALVDVTRNHPRSVNPLIKSNNLLNNALAMQQALTRGGFEALMRNYKGELCECSQSNFFLVRKGEVVTAPLEAGLLAGITRGFVFEIGRDCGIPVREATLLEADLASADEAFLTSTTREIVPIVAVDDARIGTGRPGPVTRALLAAFRRHTDAYQSETAQVS